MYNPSRSSLPRRPLMPTMVLICTHLIQRVLASRFFAGLITGILLTCIIYPSTFISNRPQYRSDQSKMEYEKNQFSSADAEAHPSSIWNSSWDGLKSKGPSPRYLYLIRHGQYFDNAKSAEEMKLTALGREQLQYTGKRLEQMNITFTRMIHSGMVRAVESAQIINEQLTRKLPAIEDRNLTEGLPVAPIPYAGISQQYVDAIGDRARVDHAFATYFHRATSDQRRETHDILVFHANLLRYFICKVMQFPVQAWLRITLNHGSITQITILSDGSVLMKSVGDSGFIPSHKVTF